MTRLVAITQPYVPAYRFPLWEAVVSNLREGGIEARIFHGGDRAQMRVREQRGDSVDAPWAERVASRTVPVPGTPHKFSYRQLPARWRSALLLTEMEGANLNAWEARLRRRPYVTLGHGHEYTSAPNAIGSALETWLNRGARHCLTYLDSGRRTVLERTGAPSERVTAFNNATDTASLSAALAGIGDTEIEAFRSEHGIPPEARVALVLSALNEFKLVDLLVDAATIALAKDQSSWMVVAGDGPERPKIEKLAQATGRVILLGQAGPSTYAPAARIAHVLLNPGRIGLVAVDALAMRLPVLTSRAATHAPEREYLNTGVNLFETEPTAESFAEGWLARPQITGTPQETPTIEAAAARISSVLLRVVGTS